MSENVFGNRLRELLEENDIEGKQFAKYLSVEPPTISNWLNGNRFPKERQVLVKIALYFNVSLDWLLGKTDIKKPYKELTDEEIISLAAHKVGHEGKLSDDELEKVKMAIQIALMKHKK